MRPVPVCLAAITVAISVSALAGCTAGGDEREARGLGATEPALNLCVVNRVEAPLTVTPVEVAEPVDVEVDNKWCADSVSSSLAIDMVMSQTELGWQLGLDSSGGSTEPVYVDAVNMDTHEDTSFSITPGQVVDLEGFPALRVEYGDETVWLKFDE